MHVLRLSLGITAAAALAAAGFAAMDVWLDHGRLVFLALGRDELVKSCSASLTGRLAEKGFEPSDLDVEARPTLDVPWRSVKSIEGHFTFRDGPEQTRVDGVMACLVSRTGVTVDFRVGSAPHREA